jgi:tetratricopeptide (TPR) repeat protein
MRQDLVRAAAAARRGAMPVPFTRRLTGLACAAAVVASACLAVGCSSAPSRQSQTARGPAADSAASASSTAAASAITAGELECQERGSVRKTGAGSAEVPEAVQSAYAAALADMQAGNWSAAEHGFESLMRDSPTLPGPYVNAAIAYVHDGREDDALAALRKALTIDPTSVQANDELGILLRRRGDFAGAEKAYRQALETDPNYPLALYNLGVLLDVYLGRRDEALALYERYQKTLPAPDKTVAGWIVDLQRRTAARTAANESKETAF